MLQRPIANRTMVIGQAGQGPDTDRHFCDAFYNTITTTSLPLQLHLLTTSALQALVQAFVHCRLDYCNPLLTGFADTHLKCFQNAVACPMGVTKSCSGRSGPN